MKLGGPCTPSPGLYPSHCYATEVYTVCVAAAEVYGRHGVWQGVAVQPQSQDARREGHVHIQRTSGAGLHRPEEPVLSQELPVRRRLDS